MRPHHEVVIVGLGPVGAVAGLLLARQGIAPVILERGAEVCDLSRAIALDDEALRIIQNAGVEPSECFPILASQVVRVRSRHGSSLIEIPPRRSPFGHPELAFFHQPDLERALRACLRDSGAEVRLGHVIDGVRQDRHGVMVQGTDLVSGRRFEIAAAYALGCDGARSAVRRSLRLGMPGRTLRGRWLVVDTLTPPTGQSAAFEFICDPDRPAVNGPLPGGRHRWEFLLDPGEDRHWGEDDLRAWLAHRIDTGRTRVLSARTASFHARMAPRWRRGRVFLLGDAAHLSPPFTGQGLSAGLRDAGNLAWKLGLVLRGRAGARVLDSYERERRAHVGLSLVLTTALGAAITARAAGAAALRDSVLACAMRLRPSRRWIQEGGWRVRPTYRRGVVAPRSGRGRDSARGRLLPQPMVRVDDGRQMRLDDVLGPGFALVGLECDPQRFLADADRSMLAGVGCRFVMVMPGDAAVGAGATGDTVVVDDGGSLRRWMRMSRESVVLVRPDRHVFAACAAGATPSVIRDLGVALGETPGGRRCSCRLP